MAISSKTAQDFVPIQEIRNETVIMKDGSLRAIILCSSINFALKSEDERTATLAQFQNFLNSLDFDIQITVQSRKMDIKTYLTLLEAREKEQINDLMRIQLREYVAFIKDLTEKINIMTKNFFIVVPYIPAGIGNKKGTGFFPFGKRQNTEEKNQSFTESKSQLDERLSFVMQGITRTGVRAQRLSTEELVELYYRTFNPGDTQDPAQVE